MQVIVHNQNFVYPSHVTIRSQVHGQVDFDISFDTYNGDLILTPRMCYSAFQIRVHDLDIAYYDFPNCTYVDGVYEKTLPFHEDNIYDDIVEHCIVNALNKDRTNWDDSRCTFELMY